MGSYEHLLIGSLVVQSTKDGVDPHVVSLFRESDKEEVQADEDYEDPRKAACAEVLYNFDGEYYPGFDEYEDHGNPRPPYWCYFMYAREARDRLEVMGFTLTKTLQLFEERVAHYQRIYSPDNPYRQGLAPDDKRERDERLLQGLTFEKWSSHLMELVSASTFVSLGVEIDELYSSYASAGTKSDELPFWFGEIWEENDIRFLLRAIIECCEEETPVIHNTTRLVEGGWYDKADEIYSLIYATTVTEYRTLGPIVVLTEGSTDQHALSSALELLYPHLTGFFSFMDFAGSNTAGGAPSLVSTVRSFAGAGIINRVVALFDNDAAAHDAVRGLARVQLPDNIRVMHYPYLDLAASYPTMGPSGLASMDINGSACSIELFFGRDTLQQETGTLSPVQWRGYIPALQRYQGEVVNKGELQRKFKDKVARSREDREYFAAADWSGIEAIFSLLRNSFGD